jgi:hypothetical protein
MHDCAENNIVALSSRFVQNYRENFDAHFSSSPEPSNVESSPGFVFLACLGCGGDTGLREERHERDDHLAERADIISKRQEKS